MLASWLRPRGLLLLTVSVLGVACATRGGDSPDGAALFARHCASCHGTFGEGDGPVATVIEAAIPNLRTLSARSGGTFPREAVLRYIDGRGMPDAHGARTMPVWGDTFTGSGPDPAANEAAARSTIAAITDFVAELQN